VEGLRPKPPVFELDAAAKPLVGFAAAAKPPEPELAPKPPLPEEAAPNPPVPLDAAPNPPNPLGLGVDTAAPKPPVAVPVLAAPKPDDGRLRPPAPEAVGAAPKPLVGRLRDGAAAKPPVLPPADVAAANPPLDDRLMDPNPPVLPLPAALNPLFWPMAAAKPLEGPAELVEAAAPKPLNPGGCSGARLANPPNPVPDVDVGVLAPLLVLAYCAGFPNPELGVLMSAGVADCPLPALLYRPGFPNPVEAAPVDEVALVEEMLEEVRESVGADSALSKGAPIETFGRIAELVGAPNPSLGADDPDSVEGGVLVLGLVNVNLAPVEVDGVVGVDWVGAGAAAAASLDSSSVVVLGFKKLNLGAPAVAPVVAPDAGVVEEAAVGVEVALPGVPSVFGFMNENTGLGGVVVEAVVSVLEAGFPNENLGLAVSPSVSAFLPNENLGTAGADADVDVEVELEDPPAGAFGVVSQKL